MQKQTDFITITNHQNNFKRDVLNYNIIKQIQQNKVKHDIEEAIKWKQNKAIEESKRDKEWDREYVQNLYKDRPGTILDFFFLNKEQRGYECPVMRQRKTDLKSSNAFNSFDDRRQTHSSKFQNVPSSYF